MRITIEETTDGRWQIWVAEELEWVEPPGSWFGTFRAGAVGINVARLIRAARAAGPAALRRRSKGAGG